MNISNISIIDEDIINYINYKIANGFSISSILREELGSDSSKKEIEKKRKLLTRRISYAGYKFNKDEKRYFLAAASDQSAIESLAAASDQSAIESLAAASDQSAIESLAAASDQSATESLAAASDQSATESLAAASDQSATESLAAANKQLPKRKYRKRNKETIVKENPLLEEMTLLSVISNIDLIYKQIQIDPKQVGVDVYENILELFKPVSDNYGYLAPSLLINAAIHSVSLHSDEFRNDTWLSDYSNFIAKNDNSKRMAIRSCKLIDSKIDSILKDLPVLRNRKSAINFSLYVYATCYFKAYPTNES